MFRKVLSAVAVVALCSGLALSDEIRAVITKVDGGKVTFSKITFDKETKKVDKGPETTLPVADNVKVSKGKFDKETKKMVAAEDVEGGLKNEMFTKIGEKGQGATIITDADNKKITGIIVGGMKKKAN